MDRDEVKIMRYEKPEVVCVADAVTIIESTSARKANVVAEGVPISQHRETANAYEADE
jgi:hypothetical protein